MFPPIGLFMAPIYQAISSAILGNIPRSSHAAMVGLIVVVSALGGTIGSFIIGQVFAALEGAAAIYLVLSPIVGLLVSITMLRKMSELEPTD